MCVCCPTEYLMGDPPFEVSSQMTGECESDLVIFQIINNIYYYHLNVYRMSQYGSLVCNEFIDRDLH